MKGFSSYDDGVKAALDCYHAAHARLLVNYLQAKNDAMTKEAPLDYGYALGYKRAVEDFSKFLAEETGK